MKRTRPWLYFLTFIFLLAGLSAFRQTAPDVYEPVALLFGVLWFITVIVLSVLVVLGKWKPMHPKNASGFGMAGVPLPRTWKRWIYDDRE